MSDKKKPENKSASNQSTEKKQTTVKSSKTSTGKKVQKRTTKGSSPTQNKTKKTVQKTGTASSHNAKTTSLKKKKKRNPLIIFLDNMKKEFAKKSNDEKYSKKISKDQQQQLNKKMMRVSKKIMRNYIIVMLVLFAVSIIFVTKIEATKSRNGYDLEEMHNKQEENIQTIESKRGKIQTEDGVDLAVDLKVYDLYAIIDPEYKLIGGDAGNVQDIEDTAKQLVEILGYEDDEEAYDYFVKQLNKDSSKYKQVYFGSYGSSISLEKKNKIIDSGLVGIGFDEQILRYYPYGDFASYIIGYASRDESGEYSGKMGAELAANQFLRGEDGTMKLRVDQYGVPIEGEVIEEHPARDGADVVTTINSVIQTYLQESMKEYLGSYEAEQIMTVVADADTGYILAAYSLPSFDPNKKDITNYVNPFTTYCYEPGSTFKSFTVAAAMNQGVYDGKTPIKTGTRSDNKWGSYQIRDWNYGIGWGTITWDEGYYLSSNTTMTYIYDAIDDPAAWDDYMINSLGFGQSITNKFYSTESCDFSPNYPVEYSTSAFGQGITVNAMQMIQAYSPIANNGVLNEPQLIKGYKDAETGEMVEEYAPIQKEVLSEEDADHILSLMDGVVNYNGVTTGTGARYKDNKYSLGIKTGQAQIAGDDGYVENQYVYSTMAVAPVEDPEILVYTVAVKPKDLEITTEAFPSYVKATVNNTLDYLLANNEDSYTSEYEYNEIKDYKEQKIEDTAKEIEKSNFKVITIGTGEVEEQFPQSGQTLAEGQTVILKGKEKNTEFPDLTNEDYSTAFQVCSMLNVECEFKGAGKVVKIEDKNNKYLITLE